MGNDDLTKLVTPPPASDEADDVVMVPKQLLFDLWRYGNIHTVEGVIYSKPHRERLREADAILLAPKALRPSPTRDETIEMCAKVADKHTWDEGRDGPFPAREDIAGYHTAASEIAAAIRALKSTPDAEGETISVPEGCVLVPKQELGSIIYDIERGFPETAMKQLEKLLSASPSKKGE